jgi:prophage regulatory protein
MPNEVLNHARIGKLLKAKDVSNLTSISRSHLHRLARDGKFPKPIKIGENRSAWLESDVQDWISECVRKHHAGGAYAR